jgi:hypothetical protein
MRGAVWALLAVLFFNWTGLAAAKSPWKKIWAASAAALVAGAALDASSSAGRIEANPLLRDSRGQFSAAKGIAIKALVTGGVLGVQALVMRKRPEARIEKPAALVNFAVAAALAGIAARNRGISHAVTASGQ